MAEDIPIIEAPAPTATAVTVVEAPAVPTKPETRVETLTKAFNTPPTERGKHAVHQPRHPQGTFAGPPQFPTPAPVVAVRPPMPKSFPKELETEWNALPQTFAERVVQREADVEKGIQPLKARAQQADELLNEFKPYEMLLRAENSTPKQAIGSLLQTAAIFRTGTPLQKLQQVAGIMQTYGIPLEHLQQMLSGQGAPAVDPQYNQLFQKINTLEQTFGQQQLQQQQQSEARSIAAIQQFAADKEHVHFEALQERMLSLLQTNKWQMENGVMPILGDTSAMSEQQKLKVAYDEAVRLDPALYAQALAAQQASQQTPQQVQKAKTAAVQVKGAPASAPATTVDPKNRRAFLANQIASMH